MDPITLATLTAAATVLGTECLKGFAGEAGKSVWGKVKKLLGWASDPQPAEIAKGVAERLQADPALGKELLSLLHALPQDHASAALVGHIDANKVQVVGGDVNISGDFRF